MDKFILQSILDNKDKDINERISLSIECLNSPENELIDLFNKSKSCCFLAYRLLEEIPLSFDFIEDNIGKLRVAVKLHQYKETFGITESEFKRDSNRWFCSLSIASIYLMIRKGDFFGASERALELYANYREAIDNNRFTAVNILRALMLAHAYSIFNSNKDTDCYDRILEVFNYFASNLDFNNCSFCVGDETVYCATIIKILVYLMPYSSKPTIGKVCGIETISNIETNKFFSKAFKKMLRI